jgi:hypothetical protein
MRRNPPLIIITGVALALAAIPSRLGARSREDPTKLREEIQRQRNPVRKVKLEIRLARAELEQVVEAYQKNHASEGQHLLDAYLTDVNDSWNVLRNSGRNAAKNPSGFMQLEIALREHARVLRDLRNRVAYFDQAPIERTLGALNQLHSRVLLSLFPGAAPPGPPAPKAGANSLVGQGSHL